MSEKPHPLRLGWLTALTSQAVSHPFCVLLIALVLTVLSLGYTLNTLSINTSTEDMLAEDLEFRQRYTAFRHALPALKGNIVIVIDGETPELTSDAAQRLSQQLMTMETTVSAVFDPASDDFFRRNGLLFLSLEELDKLSIRLAEAQPLLAALAENPSLSGLFGLLDNSLTQDETTLSAFSGAFDRLAAGAEGLRNGQTTAISWQDLLSGDASSASDTRINNRRIILVRPSLDFSSLSPAQQAVDTIRSVAATLNIDPEHGLRLRLTGTPVIEQDELLSVRKGAAVSGMLSLFLVALLTITGLRSVRLIIATLTSLIIGLIWTAGYAAITIKQLNIISVAFAVLFIGIGVDFSIQYCLRYREKRAQGLDHRHALIEAAQGVGPALSLAATAAAIGFLSFAPTDYIGLSELGQISAAGMAIALIANFTVLPSLLTLWPPQNRQARIPDTTQNTLWSDRLWHHYALYLTPVRGRRIVFVAILITIMAAGLGFERFRFDYDPLNLKDPTTESYITIRDLQSGDHSGYGIALLADSQTQAERMREHLATLPVVSRIRSPADYVPVDQDAKLAIIDDIAVYLGSALDLSPNSSTRPAENQAALASFLNNAKARQKDQDPDMMDPSLSRLVESLRPYLRADDEQLTALQNVLLGNLPSQINRLNDSLDAQLVTFDSLPPDLRQRLITEDGRHLIEVFPVEDMRDPGALTNFVETIHTAFPEATGTPILIYHAGNTVLHSFQMAAVLSVVAIGLLLLVVLGRFSEAILTAIPLLMATSLTTAVAGLSDIQLNFANMIALPLIASLGVAYGLYMILRSRSHNAIRSALMTNTPRAILFSALTTMGSFGSLALSPHRGTASMGLLMTIALTMVLVSIFTLLPALLAWREGHQSADD